MIHFQSNYWPIGLLFFLFFCGNTANCQPNADAQPKRYKGLRVSLYGLKITDQSLKYIVIRYNVVNTGREPVSFHKDRPAPESLIVELDTINLPKLLESKEQNLVWAFLQEKIVLSPGQMMQNLALKVPVNLPNQTISEPQTVPQVVATTPETPAQNNAPVTPAIVAAPAEPQTKHHIERDDTDSIQFEGFGERCVDLVFDTMYCIKQSTKTMTLHFVLRNVGDATAKLLGPTDSKEDNLAVNVYFASGSKLTRGCLLADGMFFKNKELENGLLMPGKRIWGEIDISLKERTKFNPNLIFELDPFQGIIECDKTNNTKTLLMPWE